MRTMQKQDNPRSVMRDAADTPCWVINGRFLTQQITGVQRYAREIVQNLDELLSQNKDIGARLKLHLVTPGGEVPDMQAITCRQSNFLSGHLWDQLVLPWYGGDKILSLGNFGPLAARSHVVCIHDANTFLESESYSGTFGLVYRSLLPLIGRRARRVATVSEFSARMLEKFGVCSADKIFIAPNGHEHVLRWDLRLAKLPMLKEISRPYVLLLGSKAKHKNIGVILDGAGALDAAGLDIVVVGASSKIFADDAVKTETPNVRYTGYVGDNELAALYAGALCLCFPSKTEGFGIPLLEAMTSGCPVISSNAASLTEVGGDAALYVPPDDFKGWIDCIIALSKDHNLRTSLIVKGRQRAVFFSWKKSAQIYLHELLNLR